MHEAWLLTFAREFVHLFAIILRIGAGLAFFAEWREPGQWADLYYRMHTHTEDQTARRFQIAADYGELADG